MNKRYSSIKYLFALMAMAAMLALAGGCAPRYEYKPIPVMDVSSYGHPVASLQAKAAAMAFYDRDMAKNAFGFNIVGAGVVPVQIVVENNGSKPITVLTGAKVVDINGQMWEVLPSQVVYNRINDHTSGGLSGEQGMRRTALYGLSGAIIGAAVGVASGSSVAEAAGTGAVIGGALGATSSILESESGSNSYNSTMARDFSDRNVSNREIAPHDMVHGFLYFPSEMAKPRLLKLYLSRGSQRQMVELYL